MAQGRAVWLGDPKEILRESAPYVGIDVAKARLDVAVRPSGEQCGVDLVPWLIPRDAQRAVSRHGQTRTKMGKEGP
jgi:hypothetical protein